MKHLRTEVTGSRKRRVYDLPATPYQRLKASGKISAEQQVKLAAQYAGLDPFVLRQRIEKRLAGARQLKFRISDSYNSAFLREVLHAGGRGATCGGHDQSATTQEADEGVREDWKDWSERGKGRRGP